MPGAPAPLTLVVGDEELLVSRAVSAVVAEALTRDATADVRDVAAAELNVGVLAELTSPSLFGERRVLVVRGAESCDKATAAALVARVRETPEEVTAIVVHPGGAKGRAILEALKTAGAVVVDCPKLRWPEERERFVAAEVAAAGGSISREAVLELLATVGSDLRELANASAQLVADTAGPVDLDAVARYHRGRAEATGFAVADRAVEGDAGAALELLRWSLAVGTAPVLITSSLAANLRAIAQVASAGRSGSAQAVATALGMPVWKVRKAQAWARGWHPAGIADAVRAVAAADAGVKGAAADPGYAVEAAVLAVASARGPR